jgi:serine protease Do
MPNERTSGIHQTILVLAVSVAALIGSVAGAVGAVLMTGAINAADLFGRLSSDQETVDRSIVELIEEESATISVVDQAAPAVVSVVIKKPSGSFTREEWEYYDPFFLPPIPPTPEETAELIEIGGGTGVLVSADGYIVTNRHVVSDDDAVYLIVTNDGAELPARVVAEDSFLDIAVLDVEGEGYPVAALGDSDRIRIGQTVIAIGNTLSEYRNTVTKGVVSGINRRVTAGDEFGAGEVLEHAIQTDAAINPGNSGGPLINLLGEVVGINTAVSFEGQSVGFAIPINDVKKIVEDVEQYGRIVRPWLGVRYLPLEEGALLVAGDRPDETAVAPGSPAKTAGLREGDIIVSVDGEPLGLDNTLGSVIGQFEPGQTIELKVLRREELMTLQATLAELKNE